MRKGEAVGNDVGLNDLTLRDFRLYSFRFICNAVGTLKMAGDLTGGKHDF